MAIDLGSSKVSVAAASKDPDGRLNIIDIVSKPMQGMERGEVTNIEHVTAAARDALGEMEENLGISVTEAFAGISGENIRSGSSSYYVFVGGQDGEIGDEDVAKLHGSMNTLPPPEGYVILDRIPQRYLIDSREETMQPVGRFGHRIEATFNFVLGNKNGVERLTKAMNRLQVKTAGIFSNAQASAVATLTDDEKELGAAVIDIGAGCTDICIWHNNIMRYVGVLPIGSDAVNEDIRSMAIRDKMIEKLKVKYGYATTEAIPEQYASNNIEIQGASKRDSKKISLVALTQIIEARLLDIVDHVVSEIKESGYADKLGSGIVLTGGGSKMAGIDILFRSKTKYDVRIGGADTSLLNDASARAADDIANTSAIGLLLLGMEQSRLTATASPLRRKGEAPKESADDNDRFVVGDDGDKTPAVGADDYDYEDERGGSFIGRIFGRKEKKEKTPKSAKQEKDPQPVKKAESRGEAKGGKKKSVWEKVFDVVDDTDDDPDIN